MSESETDKSERTGMRPVFTTPLVKCLAMAESKKGEPLEEEEILEITANAETVLMNAQQEREFREKTTDIDPENVLFDWNRARVEELEFADLPSAYVSVLAMQKDSAALEDILRAGRYEYELGEPNDELTESIGSARSPLSPPLDDEQIERIQNHELVFNINTQSFSSENAVDVNYELLQTISALIKKGAIEVFIESSYIGHHNEAWVEFAKAAADELKRSGQRTPEFYRAMFDAFVQLPIRVEDEFITCGMHHLGKADIRFDADLLESLFEVDEENGELEVKCRELMASLGIFMLALCPEGALKFGTIFNLGEEGPSLRAVWEENDVFDEEDVRFNYLGYWRLVAPSRFGFVKEINADSL